MRLRVFPWALQNRELDEMEAASWNLHHLADYCHPLALKALRPFLPWA